MASLQVSCSNSKSSYKVTFKRFNNGSDKEVTCTRAGSVSFTASGQTSKLTCKSPQEFCAARFGETQKHCDDTCGKNGRCQNRTYSVRRLNTPVRKMQAGCPSTKTPSTISTVKTSNGTTSVVSNPFGTDSNGSKWGCWCYSNEKVQAACPDLAEDRDGEGY